MTRLCSRRPLSLATGARPARAATLRRSRLPSSGSSASRVAARIGPQPGIEVSSAKSGASAASGLDRLPQQPGELLRLLAQEDQRLADPLAHCRGPQVLELLLAHGDLVAQLAAAGQDLAQLGARRVGQRGRRRPADLAVTGDQPGIDPVGLGLQAHAARKVAHPLRVDDRRQHALRHELLVRGPLVAAGSFHDHQAAGGFAQRAHQRLDAGRIVADAKPPSAARQVAVEPGLADVQANDLLFHPGPILVCGLAPLNRSGSHGCGAGSS